MVGFINQKGTSTMKKLICLSLVFFNIYGTELVLNTSSGEDYTLDILPEDSFEDVIASLKSLEASDTLFVSLNVNKSRIEAKTKQTSAFRNYSAPLSESDKENITYLLTTLADANQNPLKLLFKRDSLTKLGDQIEHIHPMTFLGFVFSNDELVVAMRKIRGSSFLWDDFGYRILDSLNREMAQGNLTIDQIFNLALSTKIDPSLIADPVFTSNWSRLIDNLIQNVQRSGNAKRYDM